MNSRNGKKSQESKSTRYIPVNGQKVYLTKTQQQAYDKMINDVRHAAQEEGRCGQPDYHKCFGDCGTCPYQTWGKFVSMNDDKSNSKEIVAVLEKGEIVLDAQKRDSVYQIIDFQEELARRLESDIRAVDTFGIKTAYGDVIPGDIRRDITDNSSITFSPNINVVFSSNGGTSDSDARNFGNKVASTALDALKEAFSRRGINNLGGAKLAQP